MNYERSDEKTDVPANPPTLFLTSDGDVRASKEPALQKRFSKLT